MSHQRLQQVWTPEDRGYAPRMLVLIGLGALIAAAVTGTAIAKADPENVYEYAFIQTLDQEGIGYPDADYALRAGYQVCNARYQGLTEMQVASGILAVSALTSHQAGYFVGAAEAAFCPEMIVAGGKVRS